MSLRYLEMLIDAYHAHRFAHLPVEIREHFVTLLTEVGQLTWNHMRMLPIGKDADNIVRLEDLAWPQVWRDVTHTISAYREGVRKRAGAKHDLKETACAAILEHFYEVWPHATRRSEAPAFLVRIDNAWAALEKQQAGWPHGRGGPKAAAGDIIFIFRLGGPSLRRLKTVADIVKRISDVSGSDFRLLGAIMHSALKGDSVPYSLLPSFVMSWPGFSKP